MQALPRCPNIALRLARAKPWLAAIAWALLLPCPGAGAQDGSAHLPMVQLSAGIHLIHAELADTEPARMRGLMFRQTLSPNYGMLFVFDRADKHCMWMRNTPMPLSVAFIDAGGSVVNIEEMKPQTDDSHCAQRPVLYALEMSAEWFRRHGVRAGDVLQGITKVPAP